MLASKAIWLALIATIPTVSFTSALIPYRTVRMRLFGWVGFTSTRRLWSSVYSWAWFLPGNHETDFLVFQFQLGSVWEPLRIVIPVTTASEVEYN